MNALVFGTIAALALLAVSLFVAEHAPWALLLAPVAFFVFARRGKGKP